MDNNLFNEVVKRLSELKMSEYKYRILVEYIKNEAKDSYFDRDKILKMIDILEEKKVEEIKQENNEDE